MAAKLLIYHMEEARMQAVEGLCAALGIEPVRVEAGAYGAPAGLLSGTLDFRELMTSPSSAKSEAGHRPAPVDEEMIVMSDLTERQFHALLDGLKEMSLRVGLKAVETPVNRHWSGEMLQEELKKERAAFYSNRT